MTIQEMQVAYHTIVRKECVRFLRIWPQTLLPPVMTTALYCVIFGTLIGSQIKGFGEVSYIQFIVPGLVMMAVITNSFSNVAGSFFGAKFQKQIEELLASPVPPVLVVAGYVTGGVLRGLLTGILVLGVSLFFADIVIAHIVLTLIFIFFTALVFSLAGLINGMCAKDFDGVSIVPTFILTPLTYLGGVFYSMSVLPPFWQHISLWNPILYMVNGFRYGFLGISDVHIGWSVVLLVSLSAILAYVSVVLFRSGRGLRV